MHHDCRRLLLPVLLCALCSISPAAWSQSVEPSTTVSYVLRHQTPAAVLAAFQPLIATAPEVECRAAPNADRIVLTGPPWAHSLFEQVLGRMDQPRADASAGAAATQPHGPRATEPTASGPTASGPNASAPTASGTSAATLQQPGARLLPPPSPSARPSPDTTQARATGVGRRLLSLPAGHAGEIRRDLIELLGQRLAVSPDPNAPWVLNTPRGPLHVELNVGRQDVLLDGPAPVVEQFSRLLDAMAQRYRPANPDSRATHRKVLMVRRDVQGDVQRIFDSTRAALQAGTFRGSVGASLDERQTGVILRLAGIQPPPVDAPPAQPEQLRQREQLRQPGNEPAEAPPAGSALPELDGVEVEMLPDLDAIILKGRGQELENLAEIIRELEQLSRETQPAIELIELRFTGSNQIAELIADSQEDLVGTRQGRAQVIPLGKPNALLLVGWGRAVEALRELIAKLDQPVSPETQFDVFRLKYASAEVIQETIEDFFDNREGELAPTVRTTVDMRTNTLIVHAAPRDMAEVARMIQRLDVQSGRVVRQTRVFEIQNTLAADLAETLDQALQPTNDAEGAAMELVLGGLGERTTIQSGILEAIQITVDARNNNVIVSAPAEAFDVIEALIQQLDSAGMVAKIKIFPIRNSDAASLVETLRSLLPSAANGGSGTPTQLPSASGESSLVPLRFSVDVRSNSIIATGSEGDLAIVDALVTRLDEADAMQRKNTVYQLKNSPAVDVALAINEFLRNTRQVETATPGAINPYDQLEKEVVVVPEPVSNKLIVSATPRYFEEIRGIIESLDAQPPQVMIQALIAEVALDDAEEFGVELGIQDSVLFDRSLLGNITTLTNTTQTSTADGVVTTTTQEIVSASNQPGFDFNSTNPLGNSGSARALESAGDVGGQAISNFALGRGSAELGFGGLVLSASSQNVSFLLRALEESRRMEVLSRPQILTLDNQPAFIQVGERVPRITGSTLTEVGQQNTVQLENVGLILAVTPRISPEGNVTMEIDAEKSNIGPESEGIPVSVSNEGTIIRSPRVEVTSAQATVSAADGETIILGGLITKSQREVHRSVPYLNQIPILRNLFRFDSEYGGRTELLIILTPHIVRSPQDMERLKQVEMARMSWCAADVFDLHGEVYTSPETSLLLPGHEEGVRVIYPHVDPRGAAAQSGSVEITPTPLDPESMLPLGPNQPSITAPANTLPPRLPTVEQAPPLDSLQPPLGPLQPPLGPSQPPLGPGQPVYPRP